MKMIIVSAGQGTRLRPLTNNKPKCMVEYNGKPIIDYILDAAEYCHIKDISIVNGYKKDMLESHLKDRGCTFFTNKEFYKTNMVYTLFNAKEFMSGDIIISYADIVYRPKILERLMASNADFSVVVDKDWKELWSLRMESPLEDAETLKIQDGHIIELGKKPNSYNEIEGQYIGLIKISKFALPKFIKFYENLDKAKNYDGKDYNNMYMTSLIQMIIDNVMDVTPVFINGGWIEIDSTEDIKAYNEKGIKF
ncbi:phosphocholine cytidylyltransferase family protein [Candidatus Woesearchaeota archaeon]|jgi:L-glutamine-phosphate cytidylyltransferase|nr:phosphocholine cytidylyltransferase family protein [Candidatus Woesearchaeota archaeon]